MRWLRVGDADAGYLTTRGVECLRWGMTTPPELIAAWISLQRWYANKGALPQLEEIGSWQLAAEEPGVEIVTHLFIDHTLGKPALYQVPLAYRARRLADDRSLVGVIDGRFAYDGPHDPAYTSALLALITGELEVNGDRTWVLGNHAGEPTPVARRVSRVLTGEQSNTSIVFEPESGIGAPIICKVFRTLHDGDNPDVELQSALAAAGSDAVPRPVGDVLAEWNDRGQPSGRARGHLAFAQEFLPGAEDAWVVACAAAALGTDFSAEAYALGVATAGVHATLAATMATRETTQHDIDAVIALMHGRLATAIGEVPALAHHAAALEAVFATAATVSWPAQQRIHGDLHLGQVLSVPARGWVLVDFEGEPLRPMRERSRLDSPIRDVAGMLRSFDYVAGSLSVAGAAGSDYDAERAHSWAARARAAFERGYSEASGCDLAENRALVDAFEIDKALYETVYEARNRPGWLRIPVAAIERLSARSATA
ncbi:MAG: phosphotransferase [Rhodoglobus sp.]|nr:phosphotransferase [Rhodoglobus sp.]